ncbi:amino acid carrier protein [Pseudomonas aeruginosa]|nr:amino acid carrier protein [Pseudomonas aeruginosa]
MVDLNGLVWGPLMLVLILGTGLYLMLGLKFMPLVRLGVGFRLLWQGRSKDDESSGEISPFQALMTCLAATVGTGNIAGWPRRLPRRSGRAVLDVVHGAGGGWPPSSLSSAGGALPREG